MKRLILEINHLLFWWYYKRVPEFFHQWTMFKSILLLRQNYEHLNKMYDDLNKVLNDASKRESEMRLENTNLKLKLKGVPQDKIDPINKMFGVNLEGKTNEEINN